METLICLCPPLSAAALFRAAKTREQPERPLPDERIKLRSVYTVGTPSHKKDRILPFVTTWTDLESVTPSEINQTEKDTDLRLHSCVGYETESNNQPTTQKTNSQIKITARCSWEGRETREGRAGQRVKHKVQEGDQASGGRHTGKCDGIVL